jgi:hypothetical protein
MTNSNRDMIFQQILKDAEFLKDHDIIEYSLLIGIHKIDKSENIVNIQPKR